MERKGRFMFIPNCHHIHTFFDGNSCLLEDSFRLAAAFMVERELEQSRQARLTKRFYERDPEHVKGDRREYIG